MPTQLSIDDANAQGLFYWVDDRGDTDAAAPEGAQVSFGSTDPNVATVDPATAKITPVAEGAAQLTVTITDANGNPLMEPDGVTPFAAPPADFQIVAGAAVGAGLQVKS